MNFIQALDKYAQSTENRLLYHTERKSGGAGSLDEAINYSLLGGGKRLTKVTGVLVPIVLWVASNWCLTTLFEGEGSFKDIFIASTYSLMPVVLIYIPVTIASNFVVATEVNILTLLTSIAFVWVGLLLFFGIMVTHDYSMGKNIVTILGTIVGMVCIMFIALLFSTLLGKIVSFVTNIVTELQFRM